MPEHLFEAWDEVSPGLRDRFVMLFLDYDGTLTPIVDRPEMAKLASKVKSVLMELAHQDDVKIVVISGRSLNDLEKLIRIPKLIYVGNHGFEIHGPKMRHVHPSAEEFKQLLRKISNRLKTAYDALPGVIVENKIFTLSVHYRQLDPEKVDFAKLLLFKEIGQYLAKSRLVLRDGKKVWDIRPAIEWDKGKTILWLFGRILFSSRGRVLPVYIGDDLTDEDAFRVLKRRGLGIRVTDKPNEATEAEHYLDTPDEVFEFLERLKQMKIAKKYETRNALR